MHLVGLHFTLIKMHHSSLNRIEVKLHLGFVNFIVYKLHFSLVLQTFERDTTVAHWLKQWTLSWVTCNTLLVITDFE